MWRLTCQHNQYSYSNAHSIIYIAHYSAHYRAATEKKDEGTFVNGLRELEPKRFGTVDGEFVIAML